MWPWPWKGNNMEKSGRGYSLRYAVDVRKRIEQIVLVVVSFLGLVVMGVVEYFKGETTLWMWMSPALIIMLIGILYMVAELFTELHIIPEGIAITLFGKTLRRFSADRIRFIGATEGAYLARRIDSIDVCDYTLQELNEMGRRYFLKKYRQKEDWPGYFARHYLLMDHVQFLTELGMHRKIWRIDWSPERLEILRQMYPDAMWLDCTRDRIFEKQLNQ